MENNILNLENLIEKANSYYYRYEFKNAIYFFDQVL